MNNLASRLLKLSDLPKIDIGIGMSHFELTARENNFSGYWSIEPESSIKVPKWDYITTWTGA
ncbi:MAG: hypothetical protein JW864_13745 [Spirochaetes bacterium]|nr:hypothetical protein [Spirochaetota bacterium]